MTPEALERLARQLALPDVGLAGQERILAATVAIVGDDLTAEIAARALGAAGVGCLRLVRRTGGDDLAGVLGAVRSSNPDVVIETCPWPATGDAWLAALDGCDAAVRSGFDDDAMLRAAVRRAVPVVVVRTHGEVVDAVSFRRHGPCPHAPLDVAIGAAAPSDGGAGAVIAGQLAAAEILMSLVAARTDTARARYTRLALDGGDTRSTDIPWAPECFACGGSGAEMAFFS